MIKNRIIALFAVIVMITAFLMPVTVYAAEESTNPITEYDMENMSLDELLEIYTITEILNHFSVMNKSDDKTDTAELPTETEINDTIDAANESSESVIPDENKAFTPDGHASVVDLAYEGDSKMFYTFKTPAGNVFYLVIDRERGGDNVYFLNAVTENDLLALAEGAPKTDDTSTSAIPSDPKTDDKNPDVTEKEPAANSEDNKPSTEKKSSTGMIIFIVIGIAAVGGTAYYMKIIRPKQQARINYDDGEEMQFEDEPDEFDEDGDEE